MIPSQISRTVAKEILVMFTLALTVLTALVMFIGVAREAASQGLGFAGTLELIPYLIPNALAFSIPGTVLFSICCVFGRMSAANEITALQAVGISPLATLRPALWIALLLSFFTVGIVNVAFTWGHQGVERVLLSSIEQIAIRKLEQDRRFEQGPLTLSVLDVDGDRLINPVIQVRQPSGKSIQIRADSATLKYAHQNRGLTFSLTNGTAVLGDQASFQFPDTFSHTVSLGDGAHHDLLTANPSHMAMWRLPTAVRQQRQEIRRQSNGIAVSTGFNLLTSRLDNIAGPDAVARTDKLQQSQRRLHRLGAERHRRWASGFTCLALVVVGIPLAIHLRAADVMTTFGICFMPTLLMYYPVFALTLDMAKDGRLPTWSVWSANCLFFVSGLMMIRQKLYS
jgi:lipopolysaccharide export system permease protein